MQTSKKIAFSLMAMYFALIVFSAYTWMTHREIPYALLQSVETPLMVVLAAYMAKSGYENYGKSKYLSHEDDSTDCRVDN